MFSTVTVTPLQRDKIINFVALHFAIIGLVSMCVEELMFLLKASCFLNDSNKHVFGHRLE